MSFSRDNLTIVKDNFAGKSKVWSYASDDNYAASNYFDPVIDVLSVGDFMLAGKKSSSQTVDLGLVTSTTSHVAINFTKAS